MKLEGLGDGGGGVGVVVASSGVEDGVVVRSLVLTDGAVVRSLVPEDGVVVRSLVPEDGVVVGSLVLEDGVVVGALVFEDGAVVRSLVFEDGVSGVDDAVSNATSSTAKEPQLASKTTITLAVANRKIRLHISRASNPSISQWSASEQSYALSKARLVVLPPPTIAATNAVNAVLRSRSFHNFLTRVERPSRLTSTARLALAIGWVKAVDQPLAIGLTYPFDVLSNDWLNQGALLIHRSNADLYRGVGAIVRD